MQKIKGAHGPEAIAMLYHGIGVRFIQHVLKSYGVHQHGRRVVRAVPRPARRRLHR